MLKRSKRPYAVSQYTFHVNSLAGTLADAVKRHVRQKFSTWDSEKEVHSTIKKQCF